MFEDDEDVKPAKARKSIKKPANKAVKAAKPKKPKVYKVAGSFTLAEDGSVLKQTKAIHAIQKGKKGNEKEYTVTFLVKTK